MKILHSIAQIDFRSGGPVRAVLDLSEALARRGHTVEVMVKHGPDTPDAWKEPDSPTTVIELGRPGIGGAWFRAEALDRARQAIKACDILHLHGIWTPQNTQFASIARQMRKPYVISCRGMLDDWCMAQRKPKKLLYLHLAGGNAMLNNAALIHCTADGELRQSARWFPKSTGVVIPNLLDLAPYENLPGPQIARDKFPQLNGPEPSLLFLSRLHYKKGVEHLIDAGRILRDRGTPHRVLIAGTGDDAYEQKLRRHAADTGMDDLVSFLGMVIGQEKISLYQAADLFVLPTSQENFGFVFFEALAAGCPLITTRGVDTWPELEAAGSTIVEQDAATIANAVPALTGDRAARDALGERGRAWVFEHLDPGRIVQAFERFYEDALAR
ncbi:MAG: glycosyltransferase [Phycisphaerales bacterium]|nr:glycosyltransferase [Planctomycetota bacterium]MCH8508055.1 glycosyltransferase [Phycisphaerales bacterium]